jgi:tetratricopeptide (TPR) repeat protein
MVHPFWQMRAALCLFIVLAALVSTGVAQNQITQQMLIGDAVSETGAKYSDIDKAIQFFANRDLNNARLLIEAAKRKDPALPPTDVIMAKLYFMTNNPAGGRASLERSAMEVPGDPEAHLILAEQAIQEGRLIEAESLYDKAIGLIDKFSENPKRKRNFQIASRNGRAGIYERRRDWASAAADLRELVKVDPSNERAHYRLGQALFMQKQYQAGYDEFKAAQTEDLKKNKNATLPSPDVAAALMYDQLSQLAEDAEAAEMQKKAEQFFARAKAKSDAATSIAHAQWLIKTGQLDKAEAALAEARKANPDVVNLMVLSGITARMKKQLKQAEDFFMEAVRLSPANIDTLNQLALLLIDQPDRAKQQRALEFAGISSRLNQRSADAQVTLAWVLSQLPNRGAEAQQALNNAIQLGLGSLSPDSRFLVAKMLVEQNPNAAKQILQGALDNDSGLIFVNRQDAKTLLDSMAK